MRNSDDYNSKNAEGYPDPTAFEALKNVNKADYRFHKLLYMIKNICEMAGFQIQGRIVLIDKETGKVWR